MRDSGHVRSKALVVAYAVHESCRGEVIGAQWNEYLRLNDYRQIEPDVREEFRAVRSLVTQGLPVAPRWKIARTDGVVDAGGKDAVPYLWWMERGEDVRPITVFISRTADVSANDGLPNDVVAAKESQGRSVVSGLLGLDEPPRRVSVSPAGVRWEADETAETS